MARKISFYAIYLLILAIATLGLGEVAVRLMGKHPYLSREQSNPLAVEVEPGGHFFVKNDRLGYTQIPGRFHVTEGDKVAFSVTNDTRTLRITRPVGSAVNGEKIWIFGCSFTYGWGVDDEDAFAWKLQSALPDVDVVNFGVSGYGTLHSLLQLQDAIAAGHKPKLAILNYASFHDERNTFLRNRRKAVVPWNKLGPLVQPYARLRGGHLEIQTVPAEYDEWPLQRKSALVNAAEEIYDRLEDTWVDSAAVTDAIIAEFIETGRQNGIPVVVLSIVDDPRARDVLKFASQHGAVTGNPSVDMQAPENYIPGDGHPSKQAHEKIAAAIEKILRNAHLI